MTWLKFDDGVPSNPKIVQAVTANGGDAGWLWFCGNCYCRKHLTDGFISDVMVPTIAPGMKRWKQAIPVLMSANLWHRVEGGYQVHDFLDWNPTKAKVEAQRKEDRTRKSRSDSERIPDGNGSDSDHTRAGAQTLLSSPVGSGSSEGGPGETVKVAAIPSMSGTRAPMGGLITPPKNWGINHGPHIAGFCDWMCLIAEDFGRFSSRLGGDSAARAWALSVRESGVIPTGKPWTFWNAQFDAAHAAAEGVATAAISDTERRNFDAWKQANPTAETTLEEFTHYARARRAG